MTNKLALRELQTRLSERLSAVQTQQTGKSWLAVECGGRGLLFPLREAGEIHPLVGLQPVPHSQSWFLGVANLRGQLHGVVDLARFLGLDASQANREQARLVGFNQQCNLNCAILVDRLSGLRSQEQLTAEKDDASSRPPFVGTRYRDAAGRIWQELNLLELAGHDFFLRIAA
ncbi:MAG: chemotaxis protein CheW [Burkholderiales bacterium]|jgi:twitching motility protein PilI|nr:chemotaxis protein CheW [Burkholderiales bacterium]